MVGKVWVMLHFRVAGNVPLLVRDFRSGMFHFWSGIGMINGSLAHYVMWLRHKVIHMVTSDAILAGWQGLSRTLELKKDRAKSK